MFIPSIKETKRFLARADLPPTGVALLAMLLVASASARGANDHHSLHAAACNRNPGLNAYTFRMSVAMAMRHFPWLHFQLSGPGQYVRGQVYSVHLDHMPFFATNFSTIDLSPLDPNMWSKQYVVRVVGRRTGWTTFALRPKKVDARDGNPLVQAFATLDARHSTRTVTMQYLHGTIQLNIRLEETDGYRLPAGGDVNIDMPGEALTAHATFTEYAVQESTVAAR